MSYTRPVHYCGLCFVFFSAVHMFQNASNQFIQCSAIVPAPLIAPIQCISSAGASTQIRHGAKLKSHACVSLLNIKKKVITALAPLLLASQRKKMEYLIQRMCGMHAQ